MFKIDESRLDPHRCEPPPLTLTEGLQEDALIWVCDVCGREFRLAPFGKCLKERWVETDDYADLALKNHLRRREAKRILRILGQQREDE